MSQHVWYCALLNYSWLFSLWQFPYKDFSMPLFMGGLEKIFYMWWLPLLNWIAPSTLATQVVLKQIQILKVAPYSLNQKVLHIKSMHHILHYHKIFEISIIMHHSFASVWMCTHHGREILIIVICQYLHHIVAFFSAVFRFYCTITIFSIMAWIYHHSFASVRVCTHQVENYLFKSFNICISQCIFIILLYLGFHFCSTVFLEKVGGVSQKNHNAPCTYSPQPHQKKILYETLVLQYCSTVYSMLQSMLSADKDCGPI